MYLSRTT